MTQFSSLLRDLSTLTFLGNEADKAYWLGEGKPEGHTPFIETDVTSVQNNAVVPKAVCSATLLIAALREQSDEPTLEGRLQALIDIAKGNLSEVEQLAVRLLANATWWARALSRDIKRITEKANGGDFADLSEQEKVKDDTVAHAVAAAMLLKLS